MQVFPGIRIHVSESGVFSVNRFVMLHFRLQYHPKVLKEETRDLPADNQGCSEKYLATVDCAVTKALMLDKIERGNQNNIAKLGALEPRLILVPNKFFLLSLDKSLRKSINIGLDRFLVEQHNFRIGPEEKLGFVTLPEESKISGSAHRRAWVMGKSGEPLRELVPRKLVNGKLHRPALHKAQDQGSVGWPASVFLDNFCHLRSTTTPDPYHRWYGNDLKLGIAQAGAWIIVCEHANVFNCPTGPFEKGQNFGLLSESARGYFNTRTPNCPLYLHMYEQICEERNEPVLNRGTPEHLTKLWYDLKELDVFHKKGTRVKLGRWGSWFKACRSWQGQRGACLLVLLYLGVKRGWWTDASSLPLTPLAQIGQPGANNDKAKQVPVAPAASSSSGSGAASSSTAVSSSSRAPGPAVSAAVSSFGGSTSSPVSLQKMSVKESNAEVKRLKCDAPHALAFCAQVLGNPFSCAIAQVVFHVCDPIVQWIDQMKTACNTPRGSENWHMDIVHGSMLKVFAQSWDKLSSPPLLEDAGFLAQSDWDVHIDVELDYDCKLAEVMFEVHCGVVKECYLSMLFWTDRFPGVFVGLLDLAVDKRETHMKHLEKQFDLLLRLESHTEKSKLRRNS